MPDRKSRRSNRQSSRHSSSSSSRIPRSRSRDRRQNSAAARSSSRLSSSYVVDDFRPPPSGPYSNPLRAASSRFSLNEQFAATRQEYSLWDDDNSSILEREEEEEEDEDEDEDEEEDEEAEVENEKKPVPPVAGDNSDSDSSSDSSTTSAASASTAKDLVVDEPEQPDWDYYDILCLSRDANLSPHDIRRAYFRLLLLFHPQSYPVQFRPLAQQYFLLVQEAFETLIDPGRRARYDLDQALAEDPDLTTTDYDPAFQEAVWRRIKGGLRTSSDLGFRLDASATVGQQKDSSGGLQWRGGGPLKLLDFVFSQSVAVEAPFLRSLAQPRITRLETFFAGEENREASFELGTPTIAVTGSMYGMADDLFRIPNHLLFDRYQPLLPLNISRQRLVQLVENRLAPLLSVKVHQEIRNRSYVPSSSEIQWLKSAIELEADILPELSISSRVFHHVVLPRLPQPTVLEANIRSTRLRDTPARVSCGIHQSFSHGTAYARADSGDWTPEGFRYIPELLKTKGLLTLTEFPFMGTPSFEMGFQSDGQPGRFSASSMSELPSGDSGMRSLDHQLDASCTHGAWTVSAAGTISSIAGFLRYSRDLVLPSFLFASSSPSSPSSPATARVEVELCSTALLDRYLALRNLWSVGRFARLGIELGVSPHSLHLSLYWSRLGQRISVPLLISPSAVSSLFCAAAVPFASLAALQLFLQHRRTKRPELNVSKAATPIAIARHRYEADNLKVLLAQPVAARQKHQSSVGGLVILRAQYGVANAQGKLLGDEVADVTVAVAALVDNSTWEPPSDASSSTESRVVIPRGVRKGRIPGFWDPAPGQIKVLRVRYSWKGKESIVEVRGREELVLPSPK